MQGLPKQTLHFPFAAGLDLKSEVRAMQPPSLAVCKNGQFDEIGGLQLRYPYLALSTNIYPSGTISNIRRAVEHNGELLVFTDVALYSWNAQLAAWVSKGTHLAIKIDEEPRFVTTGDQIEADRAELSNTIMYAWRDSGALYAAALDKTTGSVLLVPTQFTVGGAMPRLVAMESRIALVFIDTTGIAASLEYRLIDPASPVTGLGGSASTIIVKGACGNFFDVCRVIDDDQVAIVAERATTTSYEVATITGGGTFAQATKARTLDGPCAISCFPSALHVQIVRSDGAGNLDGDQMTVSGFTDTEVATFIGEYDGDLDHVAAAHRSVVDGAAFRCYVFWSSDEVNDTTDWYSKSNWIDTAAATGSQATFVRRLGVASRAFDHEGRVFVWGAFASNSYSTAGAGELQNSYFLYRDDATLHAKAISTKGGGFQERGFLPGVELTGSKVFSWCGSERRVIQLGGSIPRGYADRGPRDVTFTFDSDDARRCARLGQTLYITGGEILQYDGVQLVEVGFHVFPTFFDAGKVDDSGDVEFGTYSYKATWRDNNARGELDRSTTATVDDYEFASGEELLGVANMVPLHVTRRASYAVEVWRTLKNPGDTDAPFYLVTSKDPAGTINPNRYLSALPTDSVVATLHDNFTDTTLLGKELHPENESVIEGIAPPAATIIASTDTRLFLAGIAGDPHRVWYSKQRSEGDVAAFNEGLTVQIPPTGGSLTGLSFINETLIVFRESAIYSVPGEGLNNTASSGGYETPRCISADIGAVNHESIAVTPLGLIFKSQKGWYVLNRGFGLDYIGGPVSDYDSETVAAVHVIESRHQVRCLIASTRMIVWDYLVNQWSEWTITNGVGAAIWQGTYTYVTSAAASTERSTYTGVNYAIDVETAWIKPMDLQGRFRVYAVHVLGEYRSAHMLNVKVARDYLMTGSDPIWFDDVIPPLQTLIASSPGVPIAVRHVPTRPRDMMAIKVRITATETGDPESPPAGEACKLTGLSIEWAPKQGGYRGQNNSFPAQGG